MNTPLINSDIYITITLLFLLALSMFYTLHHRKGFNILNAIFRPAAIRDFNTPVASLQITSVIMALFAAVGYATMLLYISGQDDTWGWFGICIGVVIAFFAVKYTIIDIFFRTMFAGVEPKFIQRYHQMNVLFGIMAYLACMLLAFTFDCTPQNAIIAATVLGVMYCISIAYIFITTFWQNILSIFILFLYLCTLEILPALVLVKALRAI